MKITEIRQTPEILAELISEERDSDKDGISDAEEYLDGTHPLDPLDGRPWKLFAINIIKYWFDILMVILATCLGLFSLNNLLYWLSSQANQKK